MSPMHCCSIRIRFACISSVIKKGGLEALLRMDYVGSEALLDDVQLTVLDTYLQEHPHLTAESAAR